MGGKAYYGAALAGLAAGFFIGFLLAGEGVIPYSVATKIVVLVGALIVIIVGQVLARSAKPPEPPKRT